MISNSNINMAVGCTEFNSPYTYTRFCFVPNWLAIYLIGAAVLLNQTAYGQAPQGLVGVWQAEHIFAQSKTMQLAIRLENGNMKVSLDGKDLPISQEGDRVEFSMPDRSGQFRGTIDTKSGKPAGFWIQPPTENLNFPLATPLRFTKAKDGWSAIVRPHQDRIRLYLCISKPDGKPLEAFIRNPERNIGIRLGYMFVDIDGGKLNLRQMRGENIFEGHVLGNDHQSLAVMLPYANKPFVFHRAKRASDSGFYASHIATPYRYSKPDSIDDGWQANPASELGLDTTRLESLVQGIRDTKTTELTTPYIHSLLIARRGKLVLEEYFYGNDRSQPHDTRSAGKSVASMLIGAVMDSNDNLDEHRTLASIFGERFNEPHTNHSQTSFQLRTDWRHTMTIGHALAMQSGLDADDSNSESPGSEDVMQDQSAIQDWVAFALKVPMCRQPGTKSVYGSNNINLAAAAIAEAEQNWLPHLFAKHLAEPLGIHNYHFNLDPAGNGYMGGGIRLTARDQLKLGQVMLDRGTWKGNRVLSESWVRKSIQQHGSIHEANDYGLGWWRKKLKVNDQSIDVFHASGNGGQLIVCIPKYEMVVQMSAGNYMNFPVWYKNLTELIPQKILTSVKQMKK